MAVTSTTNASLVCSLANSRHRTFPSVPCESRVAGCLPRGRRAVRRPRGTRAVRCAREVVHRSFTVGHTCPHDCAPARAHVAPRHHVLIVCALKQRLSGVRFSGVRYSRICAWSSMRALTQARARMQCACSLTQCAHARYLRSWTRCRRSDRAPPSHGIALPFSTFYLTHNQTPFDPELDEVCVLLAPSSVVSPVQVGALS